LDTQPRCVCVSLGRRRRDAYPYTKCDANADTDGHANGDTYRYTNCNAYCYPDTYCYTQSDTETTPNSTPSSDAAVKNQCFVISR
jgi:hypothetical protein